MWFYGLESIKVSYHPTKFGGHGHCGSGDIIILVCHVTLQDHVIKGLCDFIGKCDFNVSYHPAKFGGDRRPDSGDISILVCHVILTWWCRQHLID